jgi:hypothetical protein
MRALSGAIITAAALIALGMTAQGIGSRYHAAESRVTVHEMDNGLILCLTLAVLAMLIGLGNTFVGLMYHHHRCYQEHLRLYGQPAETTGHYISS